MSCSNNVSTLTGKRHAPEGERRCHHDTARGLFCWQHLKQREGLRITKVPHAKLGLVTTKPIPQNMKVTSDAAEWAEPSIRPNAKKTGRTLKATKDIAKNTEVTVPATSAVIVKKKKMKLIKPQQNASILPIEPPLILPPSPKPKQKPKPKVKARSPADKHEIFHLKRLVALQDLWSDEKLAHELKIPVKKHVISVPARGDQLFNYPLEKLLKKELQKWTAHVNKNPRNAMTESKASAILEKIVKH